jgi:hypothetical protein
MRIPLEVVALVFTLGVACGQDRPAPAADPPAKVVLDNGLTVLLYPVAGIERVAVESFCRVGFLDEPKARTQIAHLLEHLLCKSATRSFKAGESYDLLQRKGSANAETLADWTHYDYSGPVSELESILRVEGERMTGLKFEAEVIRSEAPLCYQETDFVERNPQSGMLKHAFMAFGQAWRHGATEAKVRGGLEDIPPEELRKFFLATCHPKRRILVVAGGFDRDKALKAIREHLGLPWPVAAEDPGIDWSKVAKTSTVKWDARRRGVCIAFPPPKDDDERMILSVWGSGQMQALMGEAGIRKIADAAFCSSWGMNVGKLPAFFYGAAKEGSNSKEVADVLMARIRKSTSEMPTAAGVAQLKLMSAQLKTPPLEKSQLQTQADWAVRQMNRSPEEAMDMVLGNLALQAGLLQLATGFDPERLARALKQLDAGRLHDLLKRTFDETLRIVTFLEPAEKSR